MPSGATLNNWASCPVVSIRARAPPYERWSNYFEQLDNSPNCTVVQFGHSINARAAGYGGRCANCIPVRFRDSRGRSEQGDLGCRCQEHCRGSRYKSFPYYIYLAILGVAATCSYFRVAFGKLPSCQHKSQNTTSTYARAKQISKSKACQENKKLHTFKRRTESGIWRSCWLGGAHHAEQKH